MAGTQFALDDRNALADDPKMFLTRLKNAALLLLALVVVVGAGVFGRTLVKNLSSRNEVPQFDKFLLETANQINATLPRNVDKETRLDSTLAGPGNRMAYLYTAMTLSAKDTDPSDLTKALKPNLINSYKTNPEMAAFRSHNVELHYHYRDKSGVTIATIVISPKDF